MQNQMNQQVMMQQSPNMQPKMNHGGHEMFESQEVISGMIGMLDQYLMYSQFIKDQELKNILQRQYSFISDCYNIMVESFSTGNKPSHSTEVFNMQQSNDVFYGLKPSQPKKPVQSINELGDQCVSSFMLGQCKSMAGLLSVSACEITNPVLRRVAADSVPNFIEMAYEIFLYQNKNHYYQVPQLQQQDMNQMLGAYTTTQNTQMSQQNNNMMMQ
ncbi:spore coat protein [Metabacillus endolithicus]|uniref:Spore coat protein n=1 Tax=Metabacillus endolithicus TaxID=1535204 RepID=A0ABW5BTE4_9BACI|nr:spore coat protein [Metabacillus endolithicus]UPG63344.1 spore coat protein [Metabacillus endolithicus]